MNTKKEDTKKTADSKEDKPLKSDETPQEDPKEVLICTEEIDGIIRKHVYASMALGLAPIPLVDLVGLGAIQIDLVRVLAKKYNIPFKKNIAKTLITAFVGGVLPVASAPVFASLIKFVPFVGLTTGAVSMSILGGATTYAVGRVFNKHFVSGGTLLDMDTKKISEEFKEQYEKGKNFVFSSKKKMNNSETDTGSTEKSEPSAEPKTA